MWHYSVEIDFSKGELKALIINHPCNAKPPVRLVGERLKQAWEQLGRFTASHWEQDVLRNFWCAATAPGPATPGKRFKNGKEVQ